MTKDFDFFNNLEVRLIKNRVLEKKLCENRKEQPFSFYLLFSILASLALYISFDGEALGLGAIICTICLFMSPSLVAVSLLYAPKALYHLLYIPAFILYALRLYLTGSFSITAIVSAVSFLLPFLCGVAIYVCIDRGYTKNTLFASISVIYALFIIAQVFILFFIQKGSFSMEALGGSIDAFFGQIKTEAIATLDAQTSQVQLQSLFGYSAEASKKEILSDLGKSFDLLFSTFKITLPSYIAICCMICSFITVAIFSVFARLFKINIFVCIMDEWWTYRPSIVTIRLYDIMFFIFIISMFIKFPSGISAGIINLFIIITPMLFICAMRLMWQFLYAKTKRSLLAFTICAVILFLAFSIFSGLTFFVIGSIGTALLSIRDKSERLLLPIKLLQEKEALGE